MLFTPQQSVSLPNQGKMLANGKTVWRLYYDNAGAVKIQTSTDQAFSFGSAVTVDNTSGTNDVMLNEPMAYDRVTGRLHVLYGRRVNTAGQKPLLCHRYSDDSGATWSAEHVVDDGTIHANNRFYRVGLVARNSKLFCIYACIDNSVFTTDGLLYSRSTDGGATWTSPATLYTVGTAGEPNAALGTDGAVHISWYDSGVNANAAGDVYYARSDDGGATWPASPTRVTNGESWGRLRVFTSNGVVMLVGNTPWNTGLNNQDVGVLRSTDNGNTWSSTSVVATHTTDSLDHPWGVVDSNIAAIIYVDFSTSPRTYRTLLSTDAGASWSTGPTPVTSTVTSDAPQLVITDDMLIAFTHDNVANTDVWAQLPLFAPVPDTTAVLDNCTRANQGPPPSSSWTNGIQTTVAGEGLVIASNALARKSTGGYRQGSYWNTPLTSAAHEVLIRFASAPGAANDGLSLYVELENPGAGATTHGYYLDLTCNASLIYSWNLIRLNAIGSNTVLATDFAGNRAVAVGDYVALRRVGSQIFVYHYKTSESDWRLLRAASDSTYTAGRLIGLELLNSTQNPKIDRWIGGDLLAPSNTAAPTASGTVSFGQVLSCTAGTWANTPTRYGYQWQSSPDGSTWTNVTDATLPFLKVADSKRYRCQVTTTNSIGSATATSNALSPALLGSLALLGVGV